MLTHLTIIVNTPDRNSKNFMVNKMSTEPPFKVSNISITIPQDISQFHNCLHQKIQDSIESKLFTMEVDGRIQSIEVENDNTRNMLKKLAEDTQEVNMWLLELKKQIVNILTKSVKTE